MRRHNILAVICLLVLGPGAGDVSGQERTAPSLPDEPANWINSSPPSGEAFAGKGVVLWFFEENCPRCAGRWPELMALSKKYQDKPVVFIAVNSGTPRKTIESYVRRHKISWPVALDPARTLEPKFNVNQISLNNIYQVRLILPDGTVQMGSPNNLEAAAERAADGAKWNVDPDKIPEELTQAWQSIEFGNYSGAALSVQKGLKNNKPEIKQAAELLQEYVESQIDEQNKSAATALEAGQKWEAYKTLKQISTKFKGYSLPGELMTSLKTLEKDSAVEREQKALRILQMAQKAQNGTPSGQRRANGLLKTLQTDYPTTEAATLAEKLQNTP